MNDIPRAMVVDDEPSICKASQKILQREGFETITASSGLEALKLLEAESVDIIFTDLRMAEIGGLELLVKLQKHHPEIVPVVITGYATIASVVETMKLGAFDYLPKPFTADEMGAVAQKALKRRHQLVAQRIATPFREKDALEDLMGQSPAMSGVYRQVTKAADADHTILILAEEGTRAEVFARAIHQRGNRRDRPFAQVQCCDMDPEAVEMALFGKDVENGRTGLLLQANKGSVFLNEICHLSPDIQGRLLDLIRYRQVVPLGDVQPRDVDVQLIIGTHLDLGKMVTEGTLRQDLYLNLKVFPIQVPPLRDHREDIPMLALSYMRQANEKCNKEVSAISAEALAMLQAYPWPGNIEALDAAMGWAVIACETTMIEPRHLPRAISGGGLVDVETIPKTNKEFLVQKKRLRDQAVSALERLFVVDALQRNDFNVTKAAADVGILRPNFQALMRKHQIRSGTSG